MYQRYVITVAFLGIAACATSSPEALAPGANGRNPVASSSPTTAEEQLEVVKVPEVPASANIPEPPKEICRRESEIGSRRMKRVCRTPSEVNQAQSEAEDTLDDLQRMQEIQDIPIRH